MKRLLMLKPWEHVVLSSAMMLLLSSCTWLNEETEEPKGKNYDFLKTLDGEETPAVRESMEQENVTSPELERNEELEKLIADEATTGGKKVDVASENVSATATESTTAARFYEDYILMDGDEELAVSLVFNSAPLLDVLPAFADVLGFNYLIDSDLKGVVTLNINSMMTKRELWETFDKMLNLAGAGVVIENQLFRIVSLSKLPMQPDLRIGGGNSSEVFCYALKNELAANAVTQIKPFMGKDAVAVPLTTPNAILISDDSSNIVKLSQLLEIIDQSGKQNWQKVVLPCRNTLPSKISEELTAVLPVLGLNVMSVEDKVEQPGSVLLNGIDRLQLIVASAATEEAINMIKQWVAILDSVDASTQEQLYVYKVAHGKASELAEALSVVFQTQGTSYSIDTSTGNSRTDSVNAVVSRNSSSSDVPSNTEIDQKSSVFETPVRVFANGVYNTLTIRTTPRTYAMIKALLDRLDAVPAQVLLQVLVVEVTLTDSTQFGLEFSYKGSGKVDTISQTNYKNLNPGEGTDTGFSFLMTDPDSPDDTFAYLRALAGNNTIKVISSPQLLVRSNTEAKISVGTRVPVLNAVITDTASTMDNSLKSSIDYLDTGIILNITPQITSTELISLDVEQTLSDAVSNTVSTIDSPMINERVVQTSMTIANGRTMIIGGLIQEKINDDLQTVPILSDIPFLNRLVGDTDRSVERSEILVMITGYIINEQSPVQDMLKRYDEALQSINEFEDRRLARRQEKNELEVSDEAPEVMELSAEVDSGEEK